MLQNLCLFLYFRSFSCITEHILVFRILYLYYGAYYCISDTEVSVGTTEHFTCTKVPVGTTKQIHYTEVPVDTTGLILILQNLYLFYRYGSTHRYYRDSLYGSTRRYYWAYTYITKFILILPIRSTRRYYRDFTCTEVPVGTTEQI